MRRPLTQRGAGSAPRTDGPLLTPPPSPISSPATTALFVVLGLTLLATTCVAFEPEDELVPHIYVENEEEAIAAQEYFRERRGPFIRGAGTPALLALAPFAAAAIAALSFPNPAPTPAAATPLPSTAQKNKDNNAEAECSNDSQCSTDEFCSCGACKALPTKAGTKCHPKGKKCRSKTCVPLKGRETGINKTHRGATHLRRIFVLPRRKPPCHLL